MKKVVTLLLALVMVTSLFAGCADKTETTSTETQSTSGEQTTVETTTEESTDTGVDIDTSKTIKIGILVSDATTPEALAFRNYYTEYIQKQYNVEFIYSDELADAAGEKAAIETMIINNCKGIISFSSFDRPAQIQQCEDAGVYYAVATGTLSDEQYEQYKTYEHYIGAIGPSLSVEFQTGYDMAKYYIEMGNTNFAIFGGAAAYYTDMHIFRAAGMLQAMVDLGGDGANYLGATTAEGIIGKIYETASLELTSIGNLNIVGYVGGYDMDDAWFAKVGQMAATEGLEVILAVGNGSDFFGAATAESDVLIGSVDAYAANYGEAMSAGMLDYLAGKFSASIGPIFIATYSAINGYPIRDNDGNALALSQGYWIARNYNEFNMYYLIDSSIESPAYTKEMLDKLVGTDFTTFEGFVSSYSFEEIDNMK